MNVAIIGAGPLGRWLALAAARAGYSVLLEDVMPANLHHAQEYIRQQYTNRVQGSGFRDQGLGTREQGLGNREQGNKGTRDQGLGTRDQGLGTIDFSSTIEDAVRNADLVIDCVPDELESKLEILWLLDRMCPPRTVLATPTTRLSIADLAACTYRPGQCVAIVAEASDLTGHEFTAAEMHDGDSSAAPAQPAVSTGDQAPRPLLLRTTKQTSVTAIALVRRFWHSLGFAPRFEVEAAG